MTDKEVIKALECCIERETPKDCGKCPYKDTKGCVTEQRKNALDLINRQQAEIERLKGLLEGWKTEAYKVADEKEDLYCNAFERVITARAEAIKEFVDEIDYEILHKEFWNAHPHTSQVWLNGYEQCMRDIRVVLKDKLKEKVGEDK